MYLFVETSLTKLQHLACILHASKIRMHQGGGGGTHHWLVQFYLAKRKFANMKIWILL